MADIEDSIVVDRNTADSNSGPRVSDVHVPPHASEVELPRVEYQRENIAFEDGIPLDPLLENTPDQKDLTLPVTQTRDAMATGANEMDFLIQEPIQDLDWLDAFDLSTTSYSSVFHTAQPLWPIANSSPDSLSENTPLEPISENFEGTLPKPSTRHRGIRSERKQNAPRTLFDRMFSRRSSPELLTPPPPSLPANWKPIQITSAVRASLDSKLKPLSHLLPGDFTLPSQSALSRYVRGYFDGFHQHLPFIHTPTWSADNCDIGLFIAICALGARYCFEHDTSRSLWKAGKTVVRSKVEERDDLGLGERASSMGDTNLPSSETSLEIIDRCQAMFLLMAFSTWTGDRYLLRQALSFQSALAAVSQVEIQNFCLQIKY